MERQVIGPLREECALINGMSIQQLERAMISPATGDHFSQHLLSCDFCEGVLETLGPDIKEDLARGARAFPDRDPWKDELIQRQLAELLAKTSRKKIKEE